MPLFDQTQCKIVAAALRIAADHYDEDAAAIRAVAGGIARGVALRHDHGSPFMADHFRNQNRNTAAANRQLACCDCFAVSKEPGPVHLQQVLADQRAKAAALVVEAVPAVDEAANL